MPKECVLRAGQKMMHSRISNNTLRAAFGGLRLAAWMGRPQIGCADNEPECEMSLQMKCKVPPFWAMGRLELEEHWKKSKRAMEKLEKSSKRAMEKLQKKRRETGRRKVVARLRQ